MFYCVCLLFLLASLPLPQRGRFWIGAHLSNYHNTTKIERIYRSRLGWTLHTYIYYMHMHICTYINMTKHSVGTSLHLKHLEFSECQSLSLYVNIKSVFQSKCSGLEGLEYHSYKTMNWGLEVLGYHLNSCKAGLLCLLFSSGHTYNYIS